MFEQVIDRAAFDGILIFEVGVLFPGPDRPAIVVLIALDPPAVEHAQVESAVDADLHPARPRRFERPARVVEPHVHALDQLAGDVHVVIFEEHDVVAQLRPAGQVQHFRDDFLALAIVRMSLAGKHQLDGTALLIEDRRQAVGIAKDQ